MFCKTLFVLVAVALVAQSTEAAPRKKATTAKSVVTTVAPTTTTEAPEAITTLWEDTDSIGYYLSSIERSLGKETRRFFDQNNFKYTTKAILESNLAHLLNAEWAADNADEVTVNLIKKIILDLHPLTDYYY